MGYPRNYLVEQVNIWCVSDEDLKQWEMQRKKTQIIMNTLFINEAELTLKCLRMFTLSNVF